MKYFLSSLLMIFSLSVNSSELVPKQSIGLLELKEIVQNVCQDYPGDALCLNQGFYISEDLFNYCDNISDTKNVAVDTECVIGYLSEVDLEYGEKNWIKVGKIIVRALRPTPIAVDRAYEDPGSREYKERIERERRERERKEKK